MNGLIGGTQNCTRHLAVPKDPGHLLKKGRMETLRLIDPRFATEALKFKNRIVAELLLVVSTLSDFGKELDEITRGARNLRVLQQCINALLDHGQVWTEQFPHGLRCLDSLKIKPQP